jgi:hypothetical protein
MPSVASSISELVGQQDRESRAAQDQDFGETRKTVDDKGIAEGKGVIRPHHRRHARDNQ